MTNQSILILAGGSHEDRLLARKIRKEQVYSVILTQAQIQDFSPQEMAELNRTYAGVILSGENSDFAAAETKLATTKLPLLHWQAGMEEAVLHDFLTEVHAARTWTVENFAEAQIAAIREEVGAAKLLCGLSGGVDSSVSAMLAYRAIGKQLVCVFVDHGLMRKHEGDQVEAIFRPLLGDNFIRVNAEERFLQKLKGVTDPEEKRKIIGEEFIRVFEDEATTIPQCDFLLQGTIYPDVLESQKGSQHIKSHHNVGGLPKDIRFKAIVEPLRELFKDEVRALGTYLGMPDTQVWRQPFPGPGLAVRCLGEVNKEKLDILRDADAIFREEIANAGLYKELSQYFAVLTNMRSVGMRNNQRSYDYVLALRAIKTQDFMRAEWARLPYDLLSKVSQRITTEVPGVGRIVYEITGKPPATIEWE